MSGKFLLNGKCSRVTARPQWWFAVALVVAFAFMGGPCAAQAPPGEIAAAASPSLDALVLARKHVQDYFEKFSDLTCKESVTQIVLNNSGHAIYRKTPPTTISLKPAAGAGL